MDYSTPTLPITLFCSFSNDLTNTHSSPHCYTFSNAHIVKLYFYRQAEFAWDDPNELSRGLGDYRIPYTLLSRQDGSRIPVEELIDNRGA